MESFIFNKKTEWEQTEYQAWLTGHYMVYSIGVSFLPKKVKYPNNPLAPKVEVIEDMELTEEQKKEWRRKLFCKLECNGKKFKNKKEKQV